MKESMRLHFQKMLLPPFENSFQKIFDQVNTSLKASLQSQTEEVRFAVICILCAAVGY